MDSPIWKVRFQHEIEQAESGRATGKEGMARVCARRAAGIAVGEYFTRNRLPDSSPSAYERLKALVALPSTTPLVQETAMRLLLRITPEHTLPIEADLIASARWLAQELLGE